ncbi:MAG: hydantoinase/oxoprolinase family protein [Candidatus Odyssella sp.]|nr:hydantoinase/oxoprolinase family protein [Candidatus Odyssella sp.]
MTADPSANNRSRITVGVDVGGTYTDLFFYDEATGRSSTAKVPSTPGNQAIGFLDGLAQRANDLSRIGTIVHGTTVGTNALLERKGAPIGVVTTKGFRDVLEMRRRDRPRTWGLWGQFAPVVPRDRRIEVNERTLADGTILTPVDPAEVKAAAKLLLERGAQAVAVFFLNSYANGANERAAVAALKDVWPNDCINASSDILPEIREFERASTTALNAYLQPVVGAYIGSLEERLRGGGFGGQLLIVQSNGGVMTVDTAKSRPIRTALSGPAAGVIAGAHIAAAAGFPNVITGDVGGTSFDVALVVGGRSALAAETKIDFGLVVRTPMIEMTTIGAGGGSVAWVDRGGLLQVGPQSAGSDPGPACYGKGGGAATVTDANVVLGRINAERPIGGKLARLDVAASRAALDADVGKTLGLGTMEAAEAVIRVANALMAGAIRLVSIERGHDPKRFALMPFGGGGPLHAGALIQDVGLAQAIVPRFPGVTSALGCIVADMRHDFVRTINRPLDALDVPALDRDIVAFAGEGASLLDRAEVAFAGRETQIEFDMSYVGQTHTVSVPLVLQIARGASGVTGEAIRAAFDAAYARAYGRLLQGVPVRLLNLRVAVIGRRPPFDLAALKPDPANTLDGARRGSRKLWIDGAWRDAPVFARLDLPAGATIMGPAVLEQPDTTIFVDPGLSARVDALGNVILERR